MNCDLVQDLMPLYADGQASDASRRCIEEHTAHCPACQKLLNEMCAPLEPEPQDRTEQIMEMLYKKQRRRTMMKILAVFLAALLAVWGFLELRYSGDLIYAASTNKEKILKEMPELALTDEEQALAQTILEIPLIQEALSDSMLDSTDLNPEDLAEELAPVLPEGGNITDVFVMGRSVWINIIEGNRYTCLTYADVDSTGYVDQIGKTMAISSYDEIGPDGSLGNVKATYEMVYAVGAWEPRYQEIKTRHYWFGFLDR